MDHKDMKKALAGVCVATLLSGGGMALAASSSGRSGQPSAGGDEPQKKEAGKSG